MKNTCKLIGIIVLAAVITFAMTACNNSANGGGSTTPGGGTLIIGDTFSLSGETVVYEDPGDTEAKAVVNFVYYYFYDRDTDTDLIKPLSDYLTGIPKVEIINGKLTIELSQPKPASMEPIIDWVNWVMDSEDSGITVTPNDAKMFCVPIFISENRYWLILEGLIGNNGSDGYLVYADKDVKINGDLNHSSISWNNVSLKKGWNFLLHIYIDDDCYSEYFTTSASRTYPAGLKWVVY